MKFDLNKFLLASGVALTLVAAPAKADTSIAIGVTAHSSTWDTAGHEKEVSASGVAGANEINSTTHSHDADYGSYFIELVQKEGLAGMTFGVAHTPGEATIGTKSRTDAESPADTDSDDLGEAQIEYAITIGSGGCALLGDSNGDGTLNVLDVVLLVNLVLSQAYELCADMNSDATLNVLDIVTLANCVLTASCG